MASDADAKLQLVEASYYVAMLEKKATKIINDEKLKYPENTELVLDTVLAINAFEDILMTKARHYMTNDVVGELMGRISRQTDIIRDLVDLLDVALYTS